MLPTHKKQQEPEKTTTPKKGRVRWGGAHSFKIEEEVKIRKGDLNSKTKQKTKKIKRDWWNNLYNVIFWCCSLHETRATKTDQQRQPKRRKENRKNTRKGKKQENNKREREREERERERERDWKGEVRQAREKQRETLKNEQNQPLLQGKNRYF